MSNVNITTIITRNNKPKTKHLRGMPLLGVFQHAASALLLDMANAASYSV